MSELAAFLESCIAADEEAARAATPGPWAFHIASNLHDDAAGWIGAPGSVTESGVFVAAVSNTVEGLDDGGHIARHDPARVLADCEALRAVVAALVDAEDMIERIGPDLDKPGDAAEWANYHAWREAVELLAQPFAGRPGWRDEWGTNGHKEARG